MKTIQKLITFNIWESRPNNFFIDFSQKGITLLLLLLPFLIQGQDIKFDFISDEILTVKSNNCFTTRILVKKGGKRIYDVLVEPWEIKSLPFDYSKNRAKKLSYIAIYDNSAYLTDMDRLDRIRRNRIEEKKMIAKQLAFLRIVDEKIFNGGGFRTFGNVKQAVMAFGGASKEAWNQEWTDSKFDNLVDGSTKNTTLRAAAKAGYELRKGLEKEEYKDLDKLFTYYTNVRKSDAYFEKNMVTESAVLPKKEILRNGKFGISVSYPFLLNYVELMDEQPLPILKAKQFGDEYPFEVQLEIGRGSRNNNNNFSTLVLEYGQSGFIKNTDNQNHTLIPFNQASKITNFDVGIYLYNRFIGLDVGGSFLTIQHYLLEANNNLKKLDSELGFGIYIEPTLKLPLSKSFFLHASTKIVFAEQADIAAYRLYYFKTGVGYYFNRRYLDFSK